jgi:acetolactate synthase-1/2/3 large subunit
MTPDAPFEGDVASLLLSNGPAFIEIPIDPEQTFFPKILSSVQPDGTMKSDPLHLMKPDLPEKVRESLFIYKNHNLGNERK